MMLIDANCSTCNTSYRWLPGTPLICPNGHDNRVKAIYILPKLG